VYNVRTWKALASAALALEEERNGVHAEAVHAHLEPEAHDVQHRVLHLRIVVVQVRLGRVEPMPVVLQHISQARNTQRSGDKLFIFHFHKASGRKYRGNLSQRWIELHCTKETDEDRERVALPVRRPGPRSSSTSQRRGR
jgi:hypothetical protein